MTRSTYVPKHVARARRPGHAARVGLAARVSAQLEAQPILRALVTNAVSLASATIFTSALGLAYWFVAARKFSPAAVGFASAAVSGMTLVATFAALGLETFAVGDAQRDVRRRPALITTVLVVSGLSATVFGTAYALLIPFFAADLRPLSSTGYGVLLFVACCAATAVGMVLDQSLVGALFGRLQLYRNIFFGVAKLVLLLVGSVFLAQRGGLSLFSTWVIGATVSLGAIAIALPRWTRAFVAEVRFGAAVTFVREIARPVLRHQTLNLGLRIPLLALPVLVVSVLSVQANANFYIAWQLTNAAFVLPGSLAGMLYAIGAGDRHVLAQRLKVVLALSLGLTILAAAVLAVAAHLILSLFGEQYARNGTTTLVILALAGLPTVIKNHYVAVVRVTGRQHTAVPLVYIGAIAEMGCAYLGGRNHGLAGFATGWIIALTVEAGLMIPLIAAAIGARAAVPTSRTAL